MPATDNLFDAIPGELPAEQFDTLLATASFRLERIVSLGHVSPDGFWYDQDQHEWVLLLRGAARLRYDDRDQPLELTPGSCIHIPAHCRHRVEWTDPTQPTVWLALHYA
jgi:cupin 2 domain-containing protein